MTRSLRTCVLVATTYTNDSRVRRACESLAAAGHDVHVICLYASSLDPRYQQIGGVHVHREAPELRSLLSRTAAKARSGRSTSRRPSSADAGFGPRTMTVLRALASPMLLAHRAYTTWRFRRAVRRLTPDVIHTNDADTLPAAAPWARRGTPLVHDAHELTSGRADQFWWERALDLRAERRWLPRAQAVSTVSAGIAEILSSRLGRPVILVRNIPHAGPASREPPFHLRSSLGIPEEGRIVLQHGSRAPGRGLPTLLSAVARLPEVHLVLLGSSVRGTDAEVHRIASELGISDRVHMIEPVDSGSLLTVVSQADVGTVLIEDVSLSFRLSLPNKLFEYIVAGVPVVTSDLPAISEVVTSFGIGRTVDPQDPVAVADALQRVLADRETLHPNVTEARAELTWERESRPLLDVYERLAAGS